MQLRALARAAAAGPLKVMVPMVTLPEELAAARGHLDAVLAELAAEGVAHARPAFGMMVETPAAALTAAAFDADFYSIGSNDLTQYVMAAARDNPGVAALARPDSPAVLELIARTVAAGRARGRRGQPLRRHGLAAGAARRAARHRAAHALGGAGAGRPGQAGARRAAGRLMADGVERRTTRSRPTRRCCAQLVARRPSGTRQKMAAATGTHPSFISQITNPGLRVPLPAQHMPDDLPRLPFLAGGAGASSWRSMPARTRRSSPRSRSWRRSSAT